MSPRACSSTATPSRSSIGTATFGRSALGHRGSFHEGTRFISRLKLEIGRKSPLLLSSNVREDNDLLVADLTNPDFTERDGTFVRSGTIHIVRTIFLWEGCCFDRIEVSNFGLSRVAFTFSFGYQADFVDLFEVRGNIRAKRGESLQPVTASDSVVLSYRGLESFAGRICASDRVPPKSDRTAPRSSWNCSRTNAGLSICA
jgi:glycogen debranching enzyme